MADPLTILRGILLEGGTPNIEGDDYSLGRYKFNKNTPTAFKSSTGSNYSLGFSLFFTFKSYFKYGAYILAASRSNIQAVNFNDKKELLSYLDGGEITASIQFDSLPTSTPTMLGSISTADDTITIPEGQSIQQMDQDSQKQSDETTSSTQLPFGGSLTQKEQEQIDQQQQQQQSSTQQQQQDLGLSTQQQPQQPQQEDDNNDQYQDMAIQEFDEFKSDQIKIDPLLIHDRELTAQQQKDKSIFAEKIDTKKIKTESPLTVDTYIEQVKTKRKNMATDDNRSSFIKADIEVTKAINNREKKSSDKVSVLQSSVSFANILTNYKKFKIEDEEEKKRKRSSSSSSSSSLLSSPNVKSSPNGSPSIIPHLKNRTPIIIVPSSLTATISLYNVLEFLQHSLFRPTLEKKQEMASQNIIKPPMITFDRITTQKVTYEVIDNIKSLKPEDWYRVVAAFVQGEAWQFKDWKWSNPADLFANIRGFYVKFDDSNLPDVVKSWDVKVLHISKSKRHLDHTAQVEFWNAFDDFTNAKKSYLNH
ncbi:RNA polymerase II complex component [Dictyostelium discoideum AX4]|uniref:RNA polymerase II complex component n=1 Tax=Dictyostelium discoideum TaxID=44689 RepID=Q555G9_DICDI|nr:RNA polymerase II complex component [Dictyostelium discoideum AX4]EAL70335.2 RNA polymerase II complex component [Dictyostelium discoideum AX4]|eukprot:XP_644100.3 RNA polymerase II complex component [Dictyostelium discoideum AX4]